MAISATYWSQRKPLRGAQLNRSLAVTSKLDHFWLANENGGTILFDAAGFYNAGFGSFSGNYGNTWTQSLRGPAVKHDSTGTGSTDSKRIVVPSPTSQSFSILYGFVPSDVSSNQGIYAGASSGTIELRISNSANLSLIKEAVALVGSSNTALSVGRSYAACVTYDSGTGAWAFYLNGFADGSGTNAQTFTLADTYYLGEAASVGERVTDGFVTDFVGLWGRALTPAEGAFLTGPAAFSIFQPQVSPFHWALQAAAAGPEPLWARQMISMP